jgi:hypothetical protein
MTIPTNNYQTYAAKGLREDLSNLIFDISPEETPFTKLCKKGKAKAVRHEWQLDALDAHTSLNAHLQGDNSTAAAAVATVRAGNFTQILKKTVSVARTLQAVDKAGREDELTYQLDKRMRELKRDLEASAVQNNAATAGVAASAPVMASAESWLATNKATVGQTTSAATTPGLVAASGYVTTAPTDITQGTLSEIAVKNVIQLVWNAGGDPTVIMCSGTAKQKVSSTFTGIATRFRDVPSKQQAQIVSGADTYVSDFGVHTITPNRFMRDRTLLILDPTYWGLAALDAFRMEKLAKTGDAENYHIVGEYTLESRNEKASGKVTDFDPAL